MSVEDAPNHCQNQSEAVSTPLIKCDNKIISFVSCYLSERSERACNFSVNIEFPDFASTPMCNISVNIEFPDFTSTPMCSFSVNIEFPDFALRIGMQFKRFT
jgi:hypothetical protein